MIKLVVVLLLFLLGARLVFGQCPDLLAELCTTQSNCPTSSSLSVQRYSILYNEFNAICFGNFESEGGDIQGRVLVRGNMNAARGLSIGALLNSEEEFPYSLIVGGNANWGSGSLSPDGNGLYAGGSFTGAPELSMRRTGGPCTSSGCLENEFSKALNFFTELSTLLSSLRSNVMLDMYGNLMCNNESQVVNVLDINDERSLAAIQQGSQITGCNLDAILVINIHGDFEVNFTGSGFWQISKVIYNIIGNRTVNVKTQLEGLLLAPNSQLVQTGGVVVGNVIAQGCAARQFNLACIPPSGMGSTMGGAVSGGAIPQVPSRETEVASGSQQTGSQNIPSQSESQSVSSRSESQNIPSSSGIEVINTQSGSKSEGSSESRSGGSRETLQSTPQLPPRTGSSATQVGSLSSSQTGSQGVSQNQSQGSQGGSQGSVPSRPTQSQPSGTQVSGGLTNVSSTSGAPIIPSCTLPIWEAGFQCQGFTFELENSSVSFQDFDVVVFGNLVGNTGDIQGSAIVQNNVQLGRGFSIGDKLPSGSRYALIVGEALRWGSGALLPNLTRFYAGRLELPISLEFLLQRVNLTLPRQSLAQFFSNALECYKQISLELSRLTPNVQLQLENSRALLTCNSATELNYIVNITATQLNRVLWYEFENCNPQATWVVNVVGNENVIFQGGSFPARPNSLVFNIIGNGRNVTVLNSAILGSILAPASNVIQPGGVIVGKVIARNLEVLQVSRIACDGSSDGQLRDGNEMNANTGFVAIPIFALMMIMSFM